MTHSPQDPIQRAVASAVSSLKEVVTIVTGVIITNTVVRYITVGTYTDMRNLTEIYSWDTVFFIILLFNIIRFYHGNMRHLDDTYLLGPTGELPKDFKQVKHSYMGVDFFVILLQSIIFTVLSFLLEKPLQFSIIFAVLLSIDALWYFVVHQQAPDSSVFAHQKKWALNNIGALMGLVIVFFYSIGGSGIDTNYIYAALAVIIMTNTVIDFRISWYFYFPPGNLTPSGSKGTGPRHT